MGLPFFMCAMGVAWRPECSGGGGCADWTAGEQAVADADFDPAIGQGPHEETLNGNAGSEDDGSEHGTIPPNIEFDVYTLI
ncbi:hypothetical protein [Pseudooceanicola aestuarii]|uniref:hypothetical protein n=1 Tax=Pseudooceanicola aestuarii TaxID=2697319 RepID=UPI0013D6ED87|nr:hypothetical protein [Pseudooceanicola aestuarii]